MAYADQTAIEGELKGTTFPVSSVTVAVLTEMLDQESAVIDQYLSTQYVTPVTDSTALKILKKICTDFVVYRVAKVLKTQTGAPLPDDRFLQEATEGGAYRESKNLLKMLSNGQMSLNGATRLTGKSNIISVTPSQSTSERVFKKDEKQW